MTNPQALSLGKSADSISKKLTTEDVSIKRTTISTVDGAATSCAVTVGTTFVVVTAVPVVVPLVVVFGVAGRYLFCLIRA